MAAFTVFDKYFSHFPELTRQDNFNLFWKHALDDIKAITASPKFEEVEEKSTKSFSVNNLVFKSFMRTPISGKLFIPNKTSKPKVIILIHDYNDINTFKGFKLNKNLAYLFLQLRGHQTFQKELTSKGDNSLTTPGYMIENILDAESYYMKGLYLDTIAAIKAIRLNKDLDCSKIGVLGKGIGASAALFAAAYSKRVNAVVIDSPAFSNLNLTQNLSNSDAAKEINSFLARNKKNKHLIKRNLTYFDCINFADKVTCPVLMNIGLKSTQTPAQGAFSLFNHLLCDKTTEVFPTDGYSAGGEKMFTKSLKWLKQIISK